MLAKRTPPMRAAAKRRSQAELGCGVEPRRGVYGALAGRLTAQRRAELAIPGLPPDAQQIISRVGRGFGPPGAGVLAVL